jgi:hypothetical protein
MRDESRLELVEDGIVDKNPLHTDAVFPGLSEGAV